MKTKSKLKKLNKGENLMYWVGCGAGLVAAGWATFLNLYLLNLEISHSPYICIGFGLFLIIYFSRKWRNIK